jgi:hypothetical protein
MLQLPPSSFGSNPCSTTLSFFFPFHTPFGVTTLEPPTYPQIRPSMLAPNTLKLIFTSFVTKSPPKPWLSTSSLAKTTSSTFLPNPLPHHISLSCAPSSMSCSLCLACEAVMNHQRKTTNKEITPTHNG